MTQSEMRRLLDKHGIRLTKSLGQCFLHDTHQLDRIVAAAELSQTDKVLEVGAGLGPLTERLITQAGEILAIEKDARLVKVLKERFDAGQASSLSSYFSEPTVMGGSNLETGLSCDRSSRTGKMPVLRLLHADALEVLKAEERDWANWTMVSNLPYSVASPILVELCRGAQSPKRIAVTVQFEVAQRLMSKPGTRDYGVLTLLIQLDYAPLKWFRIPATSFFPRPKVDSACVILDRRSALLVPWEQRATYVRIVKRAFSQRRKMMLKLLKQDWPPQLLETAYAQAGLSPTTRAEAVSLDQFVELTRTLTDTSRGAA